MPRHRTSLTTIECLARLEVLEHHVQGIADFDSCFPQLQRTAPPAVALRQEAEENCIVAVDDEDADEDPDVRAIREALRVLSPLEDAHLGEAAGYASWEELIWRWFTYAKEFSEMCTRCVTRFERVPNQRAGVLGEVTDAAGLKNILHYTGMQLCELRALRFITRAAFERRKTLGLMMNCENQRTADSLMALRVFAASTYDLMQGEKLTSQRQEKPSSYASEVQARNRSATAAIGLGCAASLYTLDRAPEVEARRLCIAMAAEQMGNLLYHTYYKHTTCELIRAYPAFLAGKAVDVLETCADFAAPALREAHSLVVGALFSTFAPEAQSRLARMVCRHLTAEALSEDVAGHQHFLAHMLTIMTKQGNIDAVRAAQRLFQEATKSDKVLTRLLSDQDGAAVQLLLGLLDSNLDDPTGLPQSHAIQGDILAWVISLLRSPSGRVAMGFDPISYTRKTPQCSLQANVAHPRKPRRALKHRIMETVRDRLPPSGLADAVFVLFSVSPPSKPADWLQLWDDPQLYSDLAAALKVTDTVGSNRHCPTFEQAQRQASLNLLLSAECTKGTKTQLFCGEDRVRFDGSLCVAMRLAELYTTGPEVDSFKQHIPANFPDPLEYELEEKIDREAHAMLQNGVLSLPAICDSSNVEEDGGQETPDGRGLPLSEDFEAEDGESHSYEQSRSGHVVPEAAEIPSDQYYRVDETTVQWEAHEHWHNCSQTEGWLLWEETPQEWLQTCPAHHDAQQGGWEEMPQEWLQTYPAHQDAQQEGWEEMPQEWLQSYPAHHDAQQEGMPQEWLQAYPAHHVAQQEGMPQEWLQTYPAHHDAQQEGWETSMNWPHSTLDHEGGQQWDAQTPMEWGEDAYWSGPHTQQEHVAWACTESNQTAQTMLVLVALPVQMPPPDDVMPPEPQLSEDSFPDEEAVQAEKELPTGDTTPIAAQPTEFPDPDKKAEQAEELLFTGHITPVAVDLCSLKTGQNTPDFCWAVYHPPSAAQICAAMAPRVVGFEEMSPLRTDHNTSELLL